MQIKCLLYSAAIKDVNMVEAFKVQLFLGSYCQMCEICAPDDEIFLPSFHLLRSETPAAIRTWKVVLFTRTRGIQYKGEVSFLSEPHLFSAVE